MKLRLAFLVVLPWLALAQDTAVTITATPPLGAPKSVAVTYTGQIITLSVGNGTTDSNGLAVLNISMATHAPAPPAAGLQFDLQYITTDVSGITFTAGAASMAASKNIQCAQFAPDTMRCLITGINQTTISPGVVAVANVQTTLTPPQSSTIVTLLNPVSSTLAGQAIPSTIAAAGGVVSVPVLTFTCSPTSVGSGRAITCTVSLSKATPTPLTVNLSSSSSTLLTVPASVTVPAGALSTTFQISGN